MILSNFDIGLIESRENSTGTRLKRHNRRQLLLNRKEHGSSTDRQNSPQAKVTSHELVAARGLAQSLAAFRPSYLAFFTSFVTIFVTWVHHY